MSLNTKEIIFTALEKVLETTPVDKISISLISEKAGLSRQTFYNNFEDIYDLLLWGLYFLNKQAGDIFYNDNDIYSATTKAHNLMKEHANFYVKLVKSDMAGQFFKLYTKTCVDMCTKHVEKMTGNPVSKDIRFLIELYWSGSTYMTVQWLSSGMKESPEYISKMICHAIPHQLLRYWPDTHNK